MLELITSVNSAVNSFVWGPVMLALLVGTGDFLTFKTGFIQVKWFGYIMKHTVGGLFRKGERKEFNRSYQGHPERGEFDKKYNIAKS